MKPKQILQGEAKTVALCNNKCSVLRVYDNFAVITIPIEKWRGNTGGLAWEKHRVTSLAFDCLTKVLEIDDDGIISEDEIVEAVEETFGSNPYIQTNNIIDVCNELTATNTTKQ